MKEIHDERAAGVIADRLLELQLVTGSLVAWKMAERIVADLVAAPRTEQPREAKIRALLKQWDEEAIGDPKRLVWPMTRDLRQILDGKDG